MPIDGIGKTAIGYSYFIQNEKQVGEIPRGLDPIVKQFDYVIAVDGRYINYGGPKWPNYSIPEADKALQKYPNLVMEKCKPMFQPYKRQRYFDIAGELGVDWLMVWDTDDIIYPDPKYQNWKRFWKNLKKYAELFPDYHIFKMKSWIPSEKEWRRAYNAVRAMTWNPYIRLHRNPGQQRYALDCHWYFAPKDATDEDLILQKRGMYIADQTIDGVRFTTNSYLRGEVQLNTRDTWAWNNDCEEKRRQFFKSTRLLHVDGQEKFTWLPDDISGYYRYDDNGRPISKICEEDGSPPSDSKVQ